MTPTTFIVLAASLAGLLFGSFLNVCIARLPADESIVSPRSRCLSCGHPIRWSDNIPLLSFIALHGRCRDCRARIPWRYPAVELAMVAWSAASFLAPGHLLAVQGVDIDVLLGSFAHAAGLFLLGFFLIGLAFMDWHTGLLPNEFTIGGLCVGLFFAGVESFFVPSVRVKTFFTPEEVFIAHRFGAALAGWLLLWTINRLYTLVRKHRGMGAGDAKMLAMIGAFLGFGQGMLALLLAIAFATAAAVLLLVRRRANSSTRLPFGSYLATGGAVAAFAGPQIINWYSSLFR